MTLALALTGLPRPAAAQDAQACTDEVERLSEAFSLGDEDGQADGVIAQEPGARKDAHLNEEQRQRVEDMISQARSAGQQGDAEQCAENLTHARALLRESGIGSAQPGFAGEGEPAAGPTGSGSSGTAAGADGAVGDPAGSAADIPGDGTDSDMGGDTGTGGAEGTSSGGTTGGTGGGTSGGSGS